MRDPHIGIIINNGRQQGPVRPINTTGMERTYLYGGQYYEMSERYRNDYRRDTPYSNRGQDSRGGGRWIPLSRRSQRSYEPHITCIIPNP